MSTGFDPNWLPVLALSAALTSVMVKFDLMRPWCDAASVFERWVARAGNVATHKDAEASHAAVHQQTSTPPSCSSSMWEARSRQAEALLTSAGLDGLDTSLADIWLCDDPQVRSFMKTVPGYPSDPAQVRTFLGYLLSSREEKLPRANVAPIEQEGIYWRHLTTRLDLALRLAGLTGVDSPSADILSCADRCDPVHEVLARLPMHLPRTPEALDQHLASLRAAKVQLQASGEL